MLVLACEPTNLATDESLTLLALVPLAVSCPHLVHLGLYINAAPVNLTSTQPLTRFAQLEQFTVGASPVRDPAAVALFLSYLLPPTCEIDIGVTWYVDVDAMDPFGGLLLLQEINRLRGEWEAVAKMTRPFAQLRMEEGERRRGIEEEVDELRAKNLILLERGSDGPSVI